MNDPPPVWCPFCPEPTTVVRVVERDGEIVQECFECAMPIRMAR